MDVISLLHIEHVAKLSLLYDCTFASSKYVVSYHRLKASEKAPHVLLCPKHDHWCSCLPVGRAVLLAVPLEGHTRVPHTGYAICC